MKPITTIPPITYQTVRTLYPDAGAESAPVGIELTPYCVGAALMQALGDETAFFPPVNEVAAALLKVWPERSSSDAMKSATRIILLNDMGRVEDAWRELRDWLGT